MENTLHMIIYSLWEFHQLLQFEPNMETQTI